MWTVVFFAFLAITRSHAQETIYNAKCRFQLRLTGAATGFYKAPEKQAWYTAEENPGKATTMALLDGEIQLVSRGSLEKCTPTGPDNNFKCSYNTGFGTDAWYHFDSEGYFVWSNGSAFSRDIPAVPDGQPKHSGGGSFAMPFGIVAPLMSDKVAAIQVDKMQMKATDLCAYENTNSKRRLGSRENPLPMNGRREIRYIPLGTKVLRSPRQKFRFMGAAFQKASSSPLSKSSPPSKTQSAAVASHESSSPVSKRAEPVPSESLSKRGSVGGWLPKNATFNGDMMSSILAGIKSKFGTVSFIYEPRDSKTAVPATETSGTTASATP